MVISNLKMLIIEGFEYEGFDIITFWYVMIQ